MLLNCMFIFFIRIVETTLNTFRTILIVKNNKKIAVIVAFFEIIVWLTAIRKIVSNDFNIYGAISYAIGFALGTLIGMVITDRFSKSKINLMVSIPKNNEIVISKLKDEGYEFIITEIKDQFFKEKYLLTLSVEKIKLKEFINKEMFKSDDIEFRTSDLKKV